MGKQLGGEGKDPTTTNFPVVISIEISRPFFDFYGFPKFPVMEMYHLGNNTGLLNAYMVLRLLRMFSQGRRPGSPMFYVGWVLINPLINRVTSLTNIWGPTRTWNNIDTFHVLGVNQVFY